MILFKKAADLRKWLDGQQEKGNTAGFVPTMGALHSGHISLIQTAAKENPLTVCSIFVNPTQFNDPSDFEKYPVTIEKDILLLEEAGCDVLFLPSVKEMYPNGVKAKMYYDLGYLETVLEGKFRPGHFQGVCMVVHRLLEIVEPSMLYLGQKDYQQCMVITKLVELTGQSQKIKVIICPTLREQDGLAMSSRNMRLNETERENATTIFRVLNFIKENTGTGDLSALKEQARMQLEDAGFRVDYVEIAGAYDLSLTDDWDGKKKLVALVAAFLNQVRLIDNMLLN
ncbi:MAG TPA: pantoate--beta-alanine ligase [Chitinophagaceae bacterium]|jgi:pantoate--beta-alanine ligase|nr:pantoate--beta-alanine ligase [Chitinophagaceae bacterium]